MSISIFYSWQSDSSKKTNRNFIEDALGRAIRELRQEIDLEEALRDEDLLLDKDTKGVPGTPPIVDTIFQKISDCTVFVPDLTFVARTPGNRAVPNPNVLIEYGWALRVHGHGKMVPVMNTAYGDPSTDLLPFDMRHLRNPITYHLPDDADAETRKRAREILVRTLAEAIRLILESVPTREDATSGYEPVASTENPSTFLQPDEKFTVTDRFQLTSRTLSLPEGERLFLRLIPTQASEVMGTSKAAMNLARSGSLRPMTDDPTGYSHERNKHGAYAWTEIQGEISGLTQLFMSGELWGIDCMAINKEICMGFHDVDFGIFACVAFEELFAVTLGNYLDFAQHTLELELPLRFIAGATGVEGYRITAPAGMRIGSGQFGGRAVEENLLFEGSINEYGLPARQVLRPFFEYIWEECGLERPDKERLG